ncbi:MAG: MFS transporter [Muribaculaceae bacterium]|nr:MFS transporter [Muribaculaceae bacterium]
MKNIFKGIQSGYGTNVLPLWAVFNLYVIFICTSIPGLAISPIMGKITEIFPGTSPLASQMLEIGPNLAAIPFVFLGGWIGTRFNNNKLTAWTCLFFSLCSVCFFLIPSGNSHGMLFLIILSFLIGIAAGVLSPLSTAFIADMFGGKKRTAQYGYTSATLNLVLMGCTIATGYLAKIDWHLPFLIYLLPIIPLFFAKKFKKYITDPTQIRKTDAAANNGQKVHYKFSQQVNIGMLVRYCIFYFVITFVIAAISLYLPFRYTDSSTAGDLTSILFFGIMLSGYLLNYVLRILKKGVAIWCMIAIAGGFFLMSITSEVVLVGVGILIATFFYGIAQPYYYDRLSMASSRIALTLTLAWFASMDSIGNVVAAPVIDVIAKIFHRSTTTDPNLAFWLCTALSIVGLVIVIIRKIIVGVKDHEEVEKTKATLMDVTKPALNPAGHAAAASEAVSSTTPATTAQASTTASKQ